jgi:MFS family permease
VTRAHEGVRVQRCARVAQRCARPRSKGYDRPGTGISAAPAAYLADIVTPAVRGTSVGVYRTFGDVGTILGPVLLGVAAESWGYDGAALLLSGVVVVSTAVFAVLSRESSGPRRAEVFGAD